MASINSLSKGLPPVIEISKQSPELELENLDSLNLADESSNLEVLNSQPQDKVIITSNQQSGSPVEIEPGFNEGDQIQATKKKTTMAELRANWEKNNPAVNVKLSRSEPIPEPSTPGSYVEKRSKDLMDLLKTRGKPKEPEIKSILPPSKYGPQSVNKDESDPSQEIS